MAGPLIAIAKIQPPRLRGDVVERAALERKIAQSITSFRVTLIVAPAGCGKTIALARALLRLPADSVRVWVSVGARNAMRGMREQANAAFDALIDDVDNDLERRATWRGLYLFLASQCAACGGDWPRFFALADALRGTPAEREWPYMRPARRAVAGQLALHAGRYEQAIDDLSGAAADLGEVDLMGTEAIVRVTLARALLRTHRAADAWRTIAASVVHCQASNEAAPFLLAGPDALDELAQANDGGGDASPSVVATLRGWASMARALRGEPLAERVAPDSGATIVGLSTRELEVLERIAAGDSNKLIARAFDLSPHTVKRHVANILDKLALNTRGQAASWFHAHAPR